MAKALFELNPHLDRAELARQFAVDNKLQIENFLTEETAREIREILASGTEWGIATQAGTEGKPQSWRGRELRDPANAAAVRQALQDTDRVAASGDYAFRFQRYQIVEAVQEQWDPEGPHELLLEYLNTPEFLDAMRQITGIAELARADAHASLYGPNNFLGRHIDSHVAEGWRIAYVLNMTIDDWSPDWGGHLVFYDALGNIESGYIPRFNTLNLFMVPRAHAVTYVPPFAPRGRYAINGWLRDR